MVNRRVIKDRPTRLVIRELSPEGVDVHVKTLRLKGLWGRRLMALLRLDAATREWGHLSRLSDLGVDVPKAISLRRSGLLPKEIHLSTETVRDAWPILEGREAAPEVAAQLGAWLRSLHDLGVFHKDLHRRNLLLRDSGGWCLLDLDQVKIRRVTRSRRINNVLCVLRGFRGLRVASAFASFADAYERGDESILGSRHDLRAQADADLGAHVRKRSRRALRSNPDFESCTTAGIRWQVRRGFVPDPNCDSHLQEPEHHIKHTTNTTVSWMGPVVLKAFHKPGNWRRLLQRVRGSRARAAFRSGHLLELMGIPTPRVLGFAEGLNAAGQARALLVCARVPGALQATEFLRGLEDLGRKRLFLARCGELVGRLHRHGLAHRDLKGRNILRGEKDQAVLIDLDSLEDYRGSVPESVEQRDLRRLLRAQEELPELRLRDAIVFLRAWCRARETATRASEIFRSLRTNPHA